MLLSIIAIACLLFLPALRKEASKATFQHNEGTVFGTLYHAKYLYDKDLKKEIEVELQKVDASLSMFNPQSTISRINRGETDETDEMLNEILKLSFTINSATNGAFDPTVAPLVNAWGFGFKSGTLPNSREVDSLRTLVGLSAIHLNKGKVTKDNPLSILDLSCPDGGEPYFIPGFGKNDDNGWGGSINLIFDVGKTAKKAKKENKEK